MCLRMQVSEVTRNRSTIIVPAGNAEGEGWAAFRDILIEIDEAQHLLPTTDNISVSVLLQVSLSMTLKAHC